MISPKVVGCQTGQVSSGFGQIKTLGRNLNHTGQNEFLAMMDKQKLSVIRNGECRLCKKWGVEGFAKSPLDGLPAL